MSLLIETVAPPAAAPDPPMPPPPAEHHPSAYPATTRVEVRNRYDGSWGQGFEVAEVTPRGYRIRRSSDGSVLPTEFAPDDVRKERRRSHWWV